MTELEDRWLSVDEICKYLGVSNDTVYRWIDRLLDSRGPQDILAPLQLGQGLHVCSPCPS